MASNAAAKKLPSGEHAAVKAFQEGLRTYTESAQREASRVADKIDLTCEVMRRQIQSARPPKKDPRREDDGEVPADVIRLSAHVTPKEKE